MILQIVIMLITAYYMGSGLWAGIGYSTLMKLNITTTQR